jgi:hypothetical protein
MVMSHRGTAENRHCGEWHDPSIQIWYFPIRSQCAGKKMIRELQDVYHIPKLTLDSYPLGNYGRRDVYPVDLRIVYPTLGLCTLEVIDTADEKLEKCLGALENVSTAFSAAEEMKSVSLIKWHERMGHRGMRVVKDIAKGAVTEMAINDLPEKMPTPGDCMASLHRSRSASHSKLVYVYKRDTRIGARGPGWSDTYRIWWRRMNPFS